MLQFSREENFKKKKPFQVRTERLLGEERLVPPGYSDLQKKLTEKVKRPDKKNR